MTNAVLLAAAMLLDAALGEPRWLWARIPHPAVLMGHAVAWLDRHLNRGKDRKFLGFVAIAVLSGGAYVLGLAVEALPLSYVPELLLAAVLLAQRSLADHVGAVAGGLRLSPPAARDAVARIVGRDTRELDDAAIARAAIESAAENFSDGVVAPALWFLIFGLPGLLIYKAVNTADSMIGYLSPRYRDFGWAAARLDDVLNWVPARISALLIAVAHLRFDALPIIRRDAPLHRSPNAGWPEAAMAVCLDVALAGPRSYDGQPKEFPWVYPEGRRTIGAEDVDAAQRALWRSWAVAFALVVILAVA